AKNTSYINDYLRVIQSNLLLSIIEVYSKNGELLTRIEAKNLQNDRYHTLAESALLQDAFNKLKKACDIEFQNGVLQIKAVMPVVAPSTFESNGAVVITYPINHYFADLLRCITNTDVLIFNPRGELAASAVLNAEGQRDFGKFEFENDGFKKRHDVLPDFIFDAVNKKLNEKYCVARFNGNSYALGFSTLYKSDHSVAGIIACAIPLEKLYEVQKKTADFLKIFLLIVVVLTLIISYLFNRGLTGPLSILTQKAQIVKSGQIDDFNIPVASHDEIGILTDTFNQMTFSLKMMMNELTQTNQLLEQRLYEIKVLYDISQSINFISDTQELLSKIIQKTIEAVGAHHASIMLLNDTTDELEVKIIQGIAPHKISENKIDFENPSITGALAGAKLKSNLGIAGAVFGSAKPLIINDAPNDERFHKFPGTGYDIENMICVPLISNNKPYGVINVVNKNGGLKFSENDLHVITSIANQISLILEKVKLYEQSITDGMTKLFIHRYFQARLDEEIIRARRYQSTLSLIMLDVDHFKRFNDTYGHQMGDVVLVGVAGVVQSLIRNNIDIPARYGGEEFAVVLPETDIEGAYRLAERIRAEISKKAFEHNGKKVNVTASLGIASYPQHASNKLDLISRADMALYKSKENGRNRVSVYEP
ncbi:MAG TPA: diguanylate cyclase, partial [Candidatus Wallbacteria bacterium]|nr:diguanylate cyclase [Candidatus Wallbacteria bacterium]